MLTQRHGGWPLTMFLTPERRAVLRRHLFPEARRATACRRFARSLRARARPLAREARRDRRAERAARAGARAHAARAPPRHAASSRAQPIDRACSTTCAQTSMRSYGGFGGAPKFPHPAIDLLLRRCLRAATRALTWRYADAAHDGRRRHLRPARRRLLPLQRRRALDDPALREDALRQRPAARASTRTPGRSRGEPFYERVAEETAGWVMREMQSPEGGYYSSLDADSEGEEGKFYVWSRDEVRALLAPEEFAAVRAMLRPRPARRTSRASSGTSHRRDPAGDAARDARSNRRGASSSPRARSACAPAATRRCSSRGTR